MISLPMLAVMAAVLLSACISDWRCREVSDIHWAVLGTAGILGFASYCVLSDGFRWEYVAMAAVSFMILADILVDTGRYTLPFYLIMGVLTLVSLYHLTDSPFMAAWISVPASYLIYVGMYIFGIVRGGADVKCLICLALMFPVYPSVSPFPLIGPGDPVISGVFTFSVSVLFFGTLFVMFLGIRFALINRRAGDTGPGRFTGYMMSIEDARKSHVWPMQDVVDGEVIRCGAFDDPESAYIRLEAAGLERIWVTPMIPFIIPMTAAAVMLAIAGNPLFLI